MNVRFVPTHALLGGAGLSLWLGRGVPVGPIDLQAIQVMGAVLAMALLIHVARRRPLLGNLERPRTLVLTSMVLLSTAAIIAAAALSGFAALEVLSIVRFIARYALAMVLVVALLTFLSGRAALDRLRSALLFGAVISVGVGAAGHALPSIGSITILYGDRVQGLVNHPNQLAILLATVTPIALARALEGARRMGAWLTFLVIIVGVALTGSKANLLLLAVVVPVCTVLFAGLQRDALRRILGQTWLGALALATGGVAVMAVQAFNPRTLRTIEQLFSNPTGTTAVGTRTELWTSAIRTGLEHPWIGVGADHGPYYLAHGHAHNVVLEYFLTLGLVGLSALAVLLATVVAIAGTSVWTALCRRDLPRVDRLALIAYPMGSLVYVIGNQSSDSFGGTTLPILWITLAMAIAQLDLVGREHPRPAPAAQASPSSPASA